VTNNLTTAQLDELLGWLAEIVHEHGEVYLPIFERVSAEHERRTALDKKLAAFRQ